MNIKAIDFNHFPKMLKEIPDPPSRLFAIGELPTANDLMVAIVGTRKASEIGIKTAERFAKELSTMGFVIVSGLAMGIDTAAHRGALSCGGKTVAVLGNGLNKIYPAQNENLAQKIIANGGGIISEYESGVPSYKQNFIHRNRIISGLSLAVIIIEAPLRSGALSTAGFAASQGREVFVVPGPISHPNYCGSHKLIRDGARLVSSVDDILEDLQAQISNLPACADASADKQFTRLPSASPQANGGQAISKPKIAGQSSLLGKQILNPKFQTNEEKIIFEILKEAGRPLNIDKIIEITKLEPQVINQTMTILIINGFINETEKGYTM